MYRTIISMMVGMVISVQRLMDLMVAGFSLVIVLWIFAFIASILCCIAFFQNAKEFS